MERDPHDVLVTDLATLGRAVRPPDAGAALTVAVMARVADLPAPSRSGRRLPIAMPRRRLVLLVAAVLVALLVTPPVRAAVSDWFGFAGVVVRQDSSSRPSDAPAPPTAGAALSLDEARRLVAFQIAVPAALGPPDGVEVSADHRVLSMTWAGPDGVLRLDQFDGRLDYTFAKSAADVQFTSVAGGFALWFDRPHEVVVLEPDGRRRTETARLAGRTLIWERDGGTTLRLEGGVTLARAVAIAESVPPAR